ncbi:hypothetical protein [Bradyrhizobium sp. JYMT SZCCT0428]|uniref:hypothetical protein n=1 Tax=Bradyrhizobium sp. JYMT SZCCT0428 TaxID=2807673 RepID=UPI001BA8CB3D|nr:hypothetical protein [Bradyrhizobium sp. JYMT SZCCT0428]MBR1151097.1 hypothetical protein [Bradyrhizobium sp. JYMT SZCCT0428]
MLEFSVTIVGEHGMLERCGYRTALYLSVLITVVHCSFFLYAQSYLPHLGNGVAIYALMAAMVSAGLWLLSKIARYMGVIFYLFSAGAAAFPLFGFGKSIVMNVGFLWGATMAILSLVAASILVFSKPFAREFAAELEKRPTYKKHLLNVFAVLIVFGAAVATFNDIVNLASN